jgi:hypothetical protein
MAVDLSAAKGMFSSGLSQLAQYKWVFIILIVLAFLGGLIYFLRKLKQKKNQWTHTFKIKRLFDNGKVSDPIIIRARRFVKIKGSDVFELEKPVLGSYLSASPGEYSDLNTFSLVIDKFNRIYLDKGTLFNKEKNSMEISMVHAGIDVVNQELKDKWQQAHKQSSLLTTAQLITAGLKALGIIAMVIIGIVAIQAWGDAQVSKAQEKTQEAIAMQNLASAMETMEKIVNTQQLQIIPMLKALYGTENIAAEINKYRIIEDEED